MERPASLDPQDIADAKVNFLKCCEPLELDDVVLGQFTASDKGRGYIDVLRAERKEVSTYVYIIMLHDTGH